MCAGLNPRCDEGAGCGCAVFATRHVFPDGLLTICSGLTLLYIMFSPLLRGNAISTVLGEDSGCWRLLPLKGPAKYHLPSPTPHPIHRSANYKISTSTRMGGLPERWVEQLTQPDADNTTFSPLNPLANTVLSVTTHRDTGQRPGPSGFGVRLTGESQFQRQ